MTNPDDLAPPPSDFTAPAMDHVTQRHLTGVLGDAQRNVNRAQIGLSAQQLLVQTVANLRAAREAIDHALDVVAEIPVPTLVRYAVRPDPNLPTGPPQIIDLDSFRAPTDLRGIEKL